MPQRAHRLLRFFLHAHIDGNGGKGTRGRREERRREVSKCFPFWLYQFGDFFYFALFFSLSSPPSLFHLAFLKKISILFTIISKIVNIYFTILHKIIKNLSFLFFYNGQFSPRKSYQYYRATSKVPFPSNLWKKGFSNWYRKSV